MPRFDYECPQCGEITEVTIPLGDTSHVVWCMECERIMTKLPPNTSFTVRGFSAKNGYSNSR